MKGYFREGATVEYGERVWVILGVVGVVVLVVLGAVLFMIFRGKGGPDE